MIFARRHKEIALRHDAAGQKYLGVITE